MLRQKVRQIGAHLMVQQRLVHLRRHAARAELTDLLVVIGMLRAHRGFARLHGLLALEFLGLGRLLVLLADEFGFELRFVPLAGGAEPVFLAGVVFGARLRLLVQGHRLGPRSSPRVKRVCISSWPRRSPSARASPGLRVWPLRAGASAHRSAFARRAAPPGCLSHCPQHRSQVLWLGQQGAPPPERRAQPGCQAEGLSLQGLPRSEGAQPGRERGLGRPWRPRPVGPARQSSRRSQPWQAFSHARGERGFSYRSTSSNFSGSPMVDLDTLSVSTGLDSVMPQGVEHTTRVERLTPLATADSSDAARR